VVTKENIVYLKKNCAVASCDWSNFRTTALVAIRETKH